MTQSTDNSYLYIYIYINTRYNINVNLNLQRFINKKVTKKKSLNFIDHHPLETTHLLGVDAPWHGPGGGDVVHHPFTQAFRHLVQFEEVSHAVEHLMVTVGVGVHLLEDGGHVTEDGGVEQSWGEEKQKEKMRPTTSTCSQWTLSTVKQKKGGIWFQKGSGRLCFSQHPAGFEWFIQTLVCPGSQSCGVSIKHENLQSSVSAHKTRTFKDGRTCSPRLGLNVPEGFASFPETGVLIRLVGFWA